MLRYMERRGLRRELSRTLSRTQKSQDATGSIVGRRSAAAYLPDKEPQAPGVPQIIVYHGRPGRRAGEAQAWGH